MNVVKLSIGKIFNLDTDYFEINNIGEDLYLVRREKASQRLHGMVVDVKGGSIVVVSRLMRKNINFVVKKVVDFNHQILFCDKTPLADPSKLLYQSTNNYVYDPTNWNIHPNYEGCNVRIFCYNGKSYAVVEEVDCKSLSLERLSPGVVSHLHSLNRVDVLDALCDALEVDDIDEMFFLTSDNCNQILHLRVAHPSFLRNTTRIVTAPYVVYMDSKMADFLDFVDETTVSNMKCLTGIVDSILTPVLSSSVGFTIYKGTFPKEVATMHVLRGFNTHAPQLGCRTSQHCKWKHHYGAERRGIYNLQVIRQVHVGDVFP